MGAGRKRLPPFFHQEKNMEIKTGNIAYLTINGKKYAAKRRDYVVAITHDAVASSTATGTIQVDPSSPFVWFAAHMMDTNDPTTAAPGLVGQYENMISIQDQANNYNFSNDFIPRSAFSRDRMHGYSFEAPTVIDRNTKFQVNIKNPAAASAAGITYVTLQGYSIY
jgi:hypothetical protein